jgi:hypothetical protein
MDLACACSNFLLEVIPISYAYISYSSFIPLSLYWCACSQVSFRVAPLVPASIVIVFECEQINCPMVCTSKFVRSLVRIGTLSLFKADIQTERILEYKICFSNTQTISILSGFMSVTMG